MTSAEPFPAANLRYWSCEYLAVVLNKDTGGVRVEYARVCDIERGGIELLEHDFRHSFSVLRRVPSRLGDQDGMFCRVYMHHVLERVSNECRYGLEIGDYLMSELQPAIEQQQNALMPSWIGLPTFMFARHMDGPCCPMNNFEDEGPSPSILVSPSADSLMKP